MINNRNFSSLARNMCCPCLGTCAPNRDRALTGLLKGILSYFFRHMLVSIKTIHLTKYEKNRSFVPVWGHFTFLVPNRDKILKFNFLGFWKCYRLRSFTKSWEIVWTWWLTKKIYHITASICLDTYFFA